MITYCCVELGNITLLLASTEFSEWIHSSVVLQKIIGATTSHEKRQVNANGKWKTLDHNLLLITSTSQSISLTEATSNAYLFPVLGFCHAASSRFHFSGLVGVQSHWLL